MTLLDHRIQPRWMGTHRLRRTWLDDTSWVDLGTTAVEGHTALMVELERTLAWESVDRWMYDRRVAVPRLVASVPTEGRPPLLVEIANALGDHYDRRLARITCALYRDGRDSVAWHRDRELADPGNAIVAVLSLGGARTFKLRRFDAGRARGHGRALDLRVGWGDLVVMGGACQRDWEHGVPKAKHAEPRMAVMFRLDAPPRRFESLKARG